jgi:hypothetical protein
VGRIMGKTPIRPFPTAFAVFRSVSRRRVVAPPPVIIIVTRTWYEMQSSQGEGYLQCVTTVCTTVATRPAKVGDKLVTTQFTNSITRGFTGVENQT